MVKAAGAIVVAMAALEAGAAEVVAVEAGGLVAEGEVPRTNLSLARQAEEVLQAAPTEQEEGVSRRFLKDNCSPVVRKAEVLATKYLELGK